MPITQFNCSKQSCKTVLMTSDEQYVDSMREVAGMRVWVRTDVTLCMNSVRNYNTDVTLCIRDPESWIGDWLLSQSRAGTVNSDSDSYTALCSVGTFRRFPWSHWSCIPVSPFTVRKNGLGCVLLLAMGWAGDGVGWRGC